jgi:MFS family permease
MNRTLATLSSSFTPLREPNFRTYMIGQAISLVGTFLQITAQGWVVWELTGSNVALGTVTVLSTLPVLLFGPWAGAWADRLDRRKLLIWTQVIAMLCAFILAALVQTNLIELWHLYVLAFVLGIVTALDMPAQSAFIGDLTGMGDFRQAMNLNAMFLQVSRIIGPAFAGIIVGTLGAATAFWLNGLSFAAVIVSLVLVRAEQVRSQQGGTNAISAFVDGLQYLRTQPRLQDLIAFVVLITFFSMSIMMNIMPAIADTVLNGDASTLGILMAASGVGAFVGTAVVLPLAQAQKRIGVIVGYSVVWMGGWLIFLSQMTWTQLAMLGIFMLALAAPTVFTTATIMLQMMAPSDMRARMMSMFTMLTFGLQPFAAILVGYSADTLGVPNAVLINGVLLIVGALAVMALRAPLRQWEPETVTPVRA